MYIGQLKASSPEFYLANTAIVHKPETDSQGYVWRWGNVFDCAIDIKYTLDKECYVGSVELGLSGAGEVTLLVDGVKVKVRDAAKPVHVNLSGKEVIIRARGSFKDIHFTEAKLFGFYLDDSEPLLLPRPKTFKYSEQRVKIGALAASNTDGAFAVDFLTDSLAERYEPLPDGNGIELAFVIDPSYDSERYTVEVNASEATVTASSRLALLWGACRVIDLWDDGTLPVLTIDDKPDVPMRGFHMGLPTVDNIDFVKKFIRYVLLPYGYNHVIIEFNGAMRFDSHPEISEKWLESEKLYREGKGPRVMHADIGAEGTLLEKEQVREILDVLDSFGIEAIPEVQTLAHIEYITNAYPEFAELGKYMKTVSEDKLKGIPHTHIPEHCYCPHDERCMAIVYDILDEIVEVVRPKRFVHIGHDEAYHMGLCPECRAKGAPRVYVEHVTALHDYIAKKGLSTMLWSDMFHTNMYYTGEHFESVKRELPKDLVLLDFTWYFHLDQDIEDSLLPEGYRIMMGNLYSSHYPRYSSRIAKKGMVGGEVSTWTAVCERKFGENGKFFDLPYTAEMLWNAYSYDESDRASLTALIGQCIIPEIRDLMHGRYDLYLCGDTDLVGSFPGTDERVPEELGYLGLCEPTGNVEVGAKYDRLIFEHATLNPAPRICWQELFTVGAYTVTYEDSTSVDIPVRSAAGILYVNSEYGMPMPDNYYRHQGYVGTYFADPTYEHRTAEGTPVLLLGQVWDNPHPEKAIATVGYTPAKGEYAVLLSAGILGVKLPE
jgi:hypothetical protein